MRPEIVFTAIALLVAFVYSLSVYWVMKRRNWRPSSREAYFTATFDLTLITATLLLLAFATGPDRVLHSEAVWAVYLLVIMTGVLRLDVRVCAFMGAVAITEYLGLLAIFNLTMPDLMEGYDRVVQFSRVTLMLASTALAIGIVNRSLSLIQISGFDSLTGLATRRYFNERFTDEVARAKRQQSKLALVLFDLDHFKTINDKHGHDVGDAVLLQVASLLRMHKRKQDFLARWGGEEMAMILPDADTQSALMIARALTDAIRDASFRTENVEVKVTSSAGVAELGPDGTTLETLFSVADARVLRAKSFGRDQIVAS